MKHHYAILALLLAALAPWTDAAACSCLRPVLAEQYKDSAHVILGEVAKVELLTKNPVHDEVVTYVATVKPVETYKGSPDVEVQVTFTGRYVDPNHPAPAPSEEDVSADGTRTLVLIDGCGGGMAVGVRYFVFEKQGEPLHYAGWCSQRVMYESIIVPDYMRSLRDAR